MVERRRAVFLDRDGVINVDGGYVHRPEDFLWVPGAKDAIRVIGVAGYLAIVVTNQSGVGRGLYSEEDVNLLHAWMQQELSSSHASIDAYYCCPYFDDATVEKYRVADHPDRKPNPGMLKRAMADFQIDPSRSFMIGDKQTDMQAAARAGVAGVLFKGGDLCELVEAELAKRAWG